MQTFWAGWNHSFVVHMNEWFLLSCRRKAGTDSIIVLGDLYTDDQEQGGKQSISRLPKIKSVPGVLRPCPSDCCLTHNGLHSKECLFSHIKPLSLLKAPWKTQTWHVTLLTLEAPYMLHNLAI